MKLNELTSISPIDGRYFSKTNVLSNYFSEFALIRARLTVEIHWLAALAEHPNIPEIAPFTEKAKEDLAKIVLNFTETEARKIKDIEQKINHDIKAVEYYLKEKLIQTDLEPLKEFVHFACTSEDINNLSYAMLLKAARTEILLPELDKLYQVLAHFAHEYAATPMISRTHGQPASPTTLGKEIANFCKRIHSAREQFAHTPLLGKMNGAVGNFNAHAFAYPEVDWRLLSTEFITGLGLEPNSHTTQIEPHDSLAQYCHSLIRLNTILMDFCKDMWGYISLGYFTQKVAKNEVGSSTMPHKVNPIHFENAEGNAGVANALFGHFAEKLPISRWQRDLSDSTVLRNLGVALSHTYLVFLSIQEGLNKLTVNTSLISNELEAHWEVLAEAIQTVMRRYGVEAPYEKLKALTQGKSFDQNQMIKFVDQLALPEKVKADLKRLTPNTYLGYAQELAKLINLK